MASNLFRTIGAGLDLSDVTALNEDQLQKLEDLKLDTKLRNEDYFRDHPELQCLVTFFLEQVFVQRPQNLHKFCADFFTRPTLRYEVQKLLAQNYPIVHEPEKEESVSSEEADLCHPQQYYPWDQEGDVEAKAHEVVATQIESEISINPFAADYGDDDEDEDEEEMEL